MGLKKYEIITVGSDKRVRALRSWQVGDRYVNIGDVGGIVYDEKTLSQDGACWLFRGNFNFPGARIGGDSVVDVGEAAPGATGSPNLDILGTSTVVGAPVRFSSDQTAANAVTLTSADFEQGALTFARGANWETWKSESPNYLRTKAPIFMGSTPMTLKLDIPGYTVQAYVLDRDGVGITAPNSINTGEGVTLAVPAGQYMLIKLSKNPAAGIVPADATSAQITFTGAYETKLSVIDSRLELNPANGTGAITIRSGGVYSPIQGSKYPDTVIQGSKVVINSHATAGRDVRLVTELVNVNATIDATTADAQAVGIYHGVYNLAFTGLITSNWNVAARSLIQAYDCDNFAVSPAIFPGPATAQTANMPFIFQGCNVPGGRFYHHAQIKNTYVNVDFALAQADLGKTIANPNTLVSSEVEGMYRLYSVGSSIFGALVESYDSVRSVTLSNIANSYGTTIYKDAYLNGLFGFAGTNVFGHKVRSHPLAQVLNVQPRAVQGNFNFVTVGNTITGVVPDARFCVIPTPLRVNGSKGITIQGLPGNLKALAMFVTPAGVIRSTDVITNDPLPANKRFETMAYIRFGNADNSSPVTPADLAGVTVTVCNGCKIVNTGKTAVNMEGNIRVEDNATLVNASVVGSGYFGGNSIAQGLVAEGMVYMKDNAVFAPTITGAPKANILRMTDNASFTGAWSGAGTRLTMSDNARYGSTTALNASGVVEMRGNADISGSGSVSVSGVLVLKDDARINQGNASVSGDITLGGKYTQTAGKVWTGKRVIASQDAPTYDDNVKTQYDF